MKKSNLLVGILLTAIICLVIGYQNGFAAPETAAETAVKVAVVNVDNILEKSQKHAAWQQKMQEEEKHLRSELEKLVKEAEAVKADMGTRKAGSSDYMELMRQFMEKEAFLNAKDKFYEQQMTAKVQQWTEQFYREILDATARVAKEKNVNIVLAKEDIRSAGNVRDMMLTIRTNKVLYSAENLDITEAVLAVLDGAKQEGTK